jgi:hypothetical protein
MEEKRAIGNKERERERERERRREKKAFHPKSGERTIAGGQSRRDRAPRYAPEFY